MNRFALLVTLAACGNGNKPLNLDNHVSIGEQLLIKPGSYPCAFVFEGTPYGPYKCTVVGQRITKVDGMEPWSGTLTPIPNGVHVDGKLDCKSDPDCGKAFAVDLVKGANGTFSGRIAQGPESWWLRTGTLEIHYTGMGGEQYGNAMAPGE